MQKLPLNNSYALLAHFLAPVKSDEMFEALRSALIKNQIELEPLLLQANIQMCTPLWYFRMEQDGLLQYLPEELQQYLQALYEANVERNDELKAGLTELLVEFEKEGINSILLKGAATFVDDLYDSPGARYMGDMDILVPKDKLEACESIFDTLKYSEIPDEDREPDNLPSDERHQHINGRIKPDSPVMVEIHYKPAYGQGGRILDSSRAWVNRQSLTYNSHPTALLSPHHRVLLNTLHALQPNREFLHGDISLVQLAEFAALTTHYDQEIDWTDWYETAQQNNLRREFLTYMGLAHYLMGIPWPPTIPKLNYSDFHLQRIINSCGAYSPNKGKAATIKERVDKLRARLYFAAKLPGWVWRNPCYAPRAKDFPKRIYFLIKRLFKSKSWAKI